MAKSAGARRDRRQPAARRPQNAAAVAAGGEYPRWLPWLLLAAFAALGIVLVLHHEPWRDEADVWLMARDAPLKDLFLRAGYVGSPSLWYYLLVPFAKPFRSCMAKV